MNSFDQAGTIKMEQMGNQVIYKMTDVEYKRLKDFFDGRNK
jgi:hypothetical protein